VGIAPTIDHPNKGVKMKRLKTAGLLLASLFALGLTATSAFAALPDLGLLSKEAFPGEAKASSTAAWALEFSSGSFLTGKGVNTEFLWTKLSALGLYTAEFKDFVKGTRDCESSGAGAGNVLIGGEVHLVFTALAPPTLTVAALFLVPELTIECEGENLKVKGSMLETFEGPLNTDITTFSSELKGSQGIQNITKYFNDNGTSVSAELLFGLEGLGFKKYSLNIAEKQQFKVEGGKMVIVTG
jgi:hypothetical protein